MNPYPPGFVRVMVPQPYMVALPMAQAAMPPPPPGQSVVAGMNSALTAGLSTALTAGLNVGLNAGFRPPLPTLTASDGSSGAVTPSLASSNPSPQAALLSIPPPGISPGLTPASISQQPLLQGLQAVQHQQALLQQQFQQPGQQLQQPLVEMDLVGSRKRQHPEVDDKSLLSRWGQPSTELKVEAQEAPIDESPIQLDEYNSDLHLVIEQDGYSACNLTEPPGFCFCWAGVRGTYGVVRGKVYYEVQVTENLKTDFGSDHQEQDPHVVRVGWSVNNSPFQLGEDKNSYGYGGTGKFSTNCKFSNYGGRYGLGDVIGVMLDLDAKPPSISYSKNGQWLGVASSLHGHPAGNRDMALFPHILSKNCRFSVNFGQIPAWFPPPPDFQYMAHVPAQNRVRGYTAPLKISECEMVMLVGLPGTGKTTWAVNQDKEHPEKRYNVIGTDSLIDKMKVMGLPRKRNFSGRWDTLIEKATKCLNKLFQIGSKRKRNIILDQTNVYPSARRRKMRNFQNFIKRAAVLVVPDNELVRRANKRTVEDGKEVPESAVLEMKANFELPKDTDGLFDIIEYLEMSREQAEPLIAQYRREGQMRKGGQSGGNKFQSDNRFASQGSNFQVRLKQ